MKNIAMALLITALLSFSATSFASSWDIVGKVLTGIEGARILTGGKLDVIGNITGIGPRVIETPAVRQRVWVPNYTYREEWIPAHWEYDPRFGQVFIEGHYVTYKVENGGYWAYESPRGTHDFHGRGYR